MTLTAQLAARVYGAPPDPEAPRHIEPERVRAVEVLADARRDAPPARRTQPMRGTAC